MQAGSFENTANREAVSSGRTPVGTAPVVGASGADHSEGATGAHVELQITAVNLAGSSSAVSESRKQDSAPEPARVQQAEMTAETRAAASLELSSEAQRLALIPAQVMDTDEIAEARKQVTEAQAKVAEAMAAQRAAGQEAQAPPAATSAPQESSPQVQRAAATQATLAHASHQADMTEAVVEMQQTAQTRELNLEPQPEATTSEPRSRTAAEASPQTAPPVMDRPSEPSPASEGRPDAMSALQGRSPFESSTPGSTGQSIDIVVGEDG